MGSSATLRQLFPRADSDSSQSQEFEIVAVPGLLGPSPTNNEDSRLETLPWVTEQLPLHLERTRVLAFRYQTRLQNGLSATDVTDAAACVLQSMKKLHNKDTKIVLVGHDIGVLVIKKALSTSVAQEDYEFLAKETCLLVLSQPLYRGWCSLNSWDQLASWLIQTSGKKHEWGPLWRSLQPTADAIASVHRDYNPIRRLHSVTGRNQRDRKTVAVTTADGVASAPTQPFPTYTNKEAIQDLCLEIRSAKCPDGAYIDCIRALLQLDVQTCPADDEGSAGRIGGKWFSWIDKREEYKLWVAAGGAGALAVYGHSQMERTSVLDHVASSLQMQDEQAKGGDAEKVASKEKYEDDGDDGEDETVVVLRFAARSEDRADAMAQQLLGSLCFQLLNSRPELFAHVRCIDSAVRGSRRGWTAATLWSLLGSLLSCPHHGATYCLIDSTDCGWTADRLPAIMCALLDMLAKPDGPSHFRLAVSLRPGDGAVGGGQQHLQMLDLDGIQPAGQTGALQTLLQAEVAGFLGRAVGFQWAGVKLQNQLAERLGCTDDRLSPWSKMSRSRLVLQLLDSSRCCWPHTRENTAALVGLVPDNLGALYDKLLGEIGPNRRQWAHGVLSWLVRAVRPLRLCEMAVAAALGLDGADETPATLDSLASSVSLSIARDLERVFGSLVSIDSDGMTVRLVHRSLRHHLLHTHESANCPDPQTCVRCAADDAAMAARCLSYLSLLPAHAQPPETSGPSTQLALVDYATQCWPVHYERARPSSDRFASLFGDADLIETWSRHWWRLKGSAAADSPSTSAMALRLRAAADAGCLDLLKCLLDAAPAEIEADRDAAQGALEIAIAAGNKSMVQLLLAHRIPPGPSALHSAAANGHVELIPLLLQDGRRLHLPDDQGWTPLHYAAKNGHVEMVDCLRSTGPQPILDASSGTHKLTPLHLASQFGHAAVIRQLVHRQAASTATDDSGATPLHLACQWQQPAAVKALLSAARSICEALNATDRAGQTALHVAAASGRVDIVRLIMAAVRSTADKSEDSEEMGRQCRLLHAKDTSGKNALELAAQGGRHLVVGALLEMGQGTCLDGSTVCSAITESAALHLAASTDSARTVSLLLQAQPQQVFRVNGSGLYPIQVAAKSGHVRIVQLLCKAHATQQRSVDMAVLPAPTALYLAVERRHLAVVRTLLQFKASPDGATRSYRTSFTKLRNLLKRRPLSLFHVSNTHKTPLMVAARGGSSDIAEALIEAGAELLLTDDDGYSALHFACAMDREEVVRTILRPLLGQDGKMACHLVDHVDNRGKSALWLSVERGLGAIVRMLCVDGKASLVTDADQLPLLHLAVEKGHLDVLRYLLKETKIDVHEVYPKNSDDDDDDDGSAFPGTAFHRAVALGQLDLVQVFLDSSDRDRHAMANGPDGRGRTPLHIAAHDGHTELVKALLQAGADRHALNRQGLTPMLVAKSEEDVLALLPAAGEEDAASLLSGQERNGILLLSCQRGYEAVAEQMLSCNTSDGSTVDLVKTKDGNGQTPLLLAAANGHVAIVYQLMESLRDVGLGLQDNDGHTALIHACLHGNEVMALMLLLPAPATAPLPADAPSSQHATNADAAGDKKPTTSSYAANFEQRTAVSYAADNEQRTALSYAAEYGLDQVVRHLLDSDKIQLHPVTRDAFGRTPLWYAARKNQPTTVKLLLDHLPEETNLAADNEGMTPLHVAARQGHVDVVEALLEVYRDLDTTAAASGSPLCCAAEEGLTDVVALLLKRGADPNVASQSGRTPLHAAAAGGHTELVQTLLRQSLKPINANATDAGRRTPLWLATFHNKVEAAVILVDYLVETDGSLEIAPDIMWTPLHNAYDNVAVTRKLLSTGRVAVDAQDDEGLTPLYLAVSQRQFDVANELLLSHASPLVRNDNGVTPLHVACRSGSVSLVEQLLQEAYDLEKLPTPPLDNNGNSLLSYACQSSMDADGDAASRVVAVLLQHCDTAAAIVQRNKDGLSPLHLSVKNCSPAVTKALFAGLQPTPYAALAADGTDLQLLVLLATREGLSQSTDHFQLLLDTICANPTPAGLLGHIVLQSKSKTEEEGQDTGDAKIRTAGNGDNDNDSSYKSPKRVWVESLMDALRLFPAKLAATVTESTSDEHGWHLADHVAHLLTDAARAAHLAASQDSFKPPSAWNEDEKSEYLTIKSNENGSPVLCSLADSDEPMYVEACGVRANHPIPPTRPFYFEVKVLVDTDDAANATNAANAATSTARGGDADDPDHALVDVAVGIAEKKAGLGRRPGLGSHSCGYHTDDGYVYSTYDALPSERTVVKYKLNDTIGCYVNPTARTAAFTCGGKEVGAPCYGLGSQLFPMVSIRKPGVKICANFRVPCPSYFSPRTVPSTS